MFVQKKEIYNEIYQQQTSIAFFVLSISSQVEINWWADSLVIGSKTMKQLKEK